jgi:uncharacterized protein (UPF0332 family)
MSVVLELEPEVEETLKKRAAARGSDFEVYLQCLLKEQANSRSYEEVMAPVWNEFEQSGMSEDELDDFMNEIREEVWQGKKAERTV